MTGKIPRSWSEILRRGWPLLLAALLLPAAAIAGRATVAVEASQPAFGEAGLPFIHIFTPADYGGAPQNWAITQDRNGVIYVGNVDDGVLTFDGTRWRRIPVPDHNTVRSLALGGDGRIYVGTVGNFGYLAPGSDGRLHFVSLLDLVAPADRDFSDVWQIFPTAEGIYFSTFNHLFRLHDGRIKVWQPQTGFHLAFHVRNTLYVREFDRGLMKLAGDRLVPVPGGERFAKEKIYAMLPWTDADAAPGEVLIGTRTQGWFLFDGSHYRPWITQADAIIRKGALYGAIWLADGRLAVATLQGGVCLLDTQGHLLRRLTRANGLQTNVAFALFQDRQGGLWVAAGSRIARIGVDTPITRFDENAGLKGSLLALRRHAGTLYAGTTEGLYRLVPGAVGGATFEQVPQVSGQFWSFADMGDVLLAGNNEGVFAIGDGAPRQVLSTGQTVFSLLRSRRDPARVFVGMINGISSMRLDAGRWIDEGRLADTRDESRTLVQTADGSLWLGDWNGSALRLRLPADGLDKRGHALASVEKFGAAQGVPGGPSQVALISGQARLITTRGIYRFDQASAHFAPDPRFAGLFPEGSRQISAIQQTHDGALWMYTTDSRTGRKETGRATLDAHGRWRWSTTPLQPLAGSGMATFMEDPDGIVWLGGDKGLFRYDPARGAPADARFGALLREVTARDGAIRLAVGGTRPPRLPYSANALRFEFAAPSYDSFGANRFQVRLVGLDPGWSPWSDEAYRDYTNLPAGEYRFEVRARDVYGRVGTTASFDFLVLAPWYRTGWAWLLWIALSAAALWLLMRWRSAALRRRNRELAALVDQRTAELLRANNALAEQTITDPLTGLKNRRYVHKHIEHDVLLAQRHYHDAAACPVLAEENVNLLFLMVDIDHFKLVNDEHGHAAGDRVLEQFRDVLLAATRETDTPVRWGGEEFLVIARFTNRASGPLFAERIRAQVAAHAFDLGEGKTLRLTCSVGFCSYPFFPGEPDRLNWEQVVNLADECLYAAKHDGRNAWVGVEPGPAIPDGNLAQALRRSLQRRPEHGPLRILASSGTPAPSME